MVLGTSYVDMAKDETSKVDLLVDSIRKMTSTHHPSWKVRTAPTSTKPPLRARVDRLWPVGGGRTERARRKSGGPPLRDPTWGHRRPKPSHSRKVGAHGESARINLRHRPNKHALPLPRAQTRTCGDDPPLSPSRETDPLSRTQRSDPLLGSNLSRVSFHTFGNGTERGRVYVLCLDDWCFTTKTNSYLPGLAVVGYSSPRGASHTKTPYHAF